MNGQHAVVTQVLFFYTILKLFVKLHLSYVNLNDVIDKSRHITTNAIQKGCAENQGLSHPDTFFNASMYESMIFLMDFLIDI
jgi:hypothetical protein